MRVRSVPLALSALRGVAPGLRVTQGALGEGLGRRRQGDRVNPAPLRAPLGYLAHSPEPPRARKFTPEQA